MKVFIFAAVLAVAAAMYKPSPSIYKQDVYQPKTYGQERKYKEEPRPYAFDYAVNDHYSGANFAQKENSDGHTTQGVYTVALPDGRIQTVTYNADHYDGFNADVSYQGEAKYDSYSAPSYKATPSYKSVPTYKPTQTYKPIKSYGRSPY